MAISNLRQILTQIQEYLKELKGLKEEIENLKVENAELKKNVETIKVENENLKKQVSELEEQANLNLATAQQIVEELKVIINAQ